MSGTSAWHGLRVPPIKPRVPIRRASGEPLPAAEAEQLYNDMHGISIYVFEWDQNNETGEARRVMYRPKGVGFGRPTPEQRVAAGEWCDYQPNTFRTISARISVIGSGKVFRIEEVDGSEHHVLFEENKERMGSGHIDGPYPGGPSSADAVHDRHLEEHYNEFIEALQQEEAARKKEAGEQ